MLLKKEDSCLLLVDVQDKLAPLVRDSDAMIKRCKWLLRLAECQGVPLLVSEQYPAGLGNTVDSLHALFSRNNVIEKMHFSCWRDNGLKKRLQALACRQVVLTGIETHVCILQTAMDLSAAGYEVFVVVDAVGARYERDHNYGLKRMKQAGAQLVTSEMVFFEWQEYAGTPEFRALSKQFFLKETE